MIRRCIPPYRLTSLHIYAHALHMHAPVVSTCLPMTPAPAPKPLPSPAFPRFYLRTGGAFLPSFLPSSFLPSLPALHYVLSPAAGTNPAMHMSSPSTNISLCARIPFPGGGTPYLVPTHHHHSPSTQAAAPSVPTLVGRHPPQH